MEATKENAKQKTEKVVWFLTAIQFSVIYILESSSSGVIYLALLSIAICLVGVFEKHGKIFVKLEPFHYFVIAFALFCLASSLWAWNLNYAIEKGITIIEILICYSLVYSYYRKKNSIAPLINSIMWGCYIVMLYSIITLGWNSVLLTIRSEGRLVAHFTNTNSLGIILALAIIISIYKIQIDGIRVWHILILPAIILIAASGSRKAVILAVLGVSLLYMTKESGKAYFLKIIRLFVVIAAVIILVGFFSSLRLFSGVHNRMQGLYALITGEGVVDHSAWVRQRMIGLGWEQFLKTPILGIGMGNARIMTSVVGYDSYLHNNYIELLTNGGVVGFALYYAIYIYLIINLIRHRAKGDHISRLCLILIVCLLVMDYGAVSYYIKSTYYYFMAFFVEVLLIKNKNVIRTHERISK